MFAVYRTDSDGCTYSADTVLFVTACEQTAKDAVALAELEQEAALAVERPAWTTDDLKKYGTEYAINLRKEYSEKLAAIFTVDVWSDGEFITHVDKETSYYYEKVQVR